MISVKHYLDMSHSGFIASRLEMTVYSITDIAC